MKKFLKNKRLKLIYIDYKVVEFENCKYIVGRPSGVCGEIMSYLFVVDYDMLEKIIYILWHLQANNYIACSISVCPGVKKTLYLHNYVMNKMTFEGRGNTHSLDHINRIGTDNRRANLRDSSQTFQNYNQKQRLRKVILPSTCGINRNDLPKGVYYRPSDGKHSEHFMVEIKGLPDFPKKLRIETTKSKEFSLKCKLEEAKIIITELSKFYPEHFDCRNNFNDNLIEQTQKYNKIIKLSKFDGWERHIAKVPEKQPEKENNFTENEIKYLKTVSSHIKDYIQNAISNNESQTNDTLPNHAPTKAQTNNALTNNVPTNNAQTNNAPTTKWKKRTKETLSPNCGVTINMVPKHCYYQQATDKRGDCFVIDKHPNLNKKFGINQWRTTSVRNMTTKQKYDLLMDKLKLLKDDKGEESDHNKEDKDKEKESDHEKEDEREEDEREEDKRKKDEGEESDHEKEDEGEESNHEKDEDDN